MNCKHKDTLSVSLSNVGLLGDIRWDSQLLCRDVQFEKISYLISVHGNEIKSRNSSYYAERNCKHMLSEIAHLLSIYKENINDFSCKQFTYIIADNILCKSLRLVDYFVSIDRFHCLSELVNQLIDIVKWSAECIVCYLTNIKFPIINTNLDNLSVELENEVANGFPRVLIDGDNHVLALLAMMVQRINVDSVVGIMLGGGSSAAIASAYYKANLSYVKISKYDDSEKSNEIIFGYPIVNKSKVIIIDDNCGTGDTLKEAKSIVSKYSKEMVLLYPIELHWEKFLRVNVCGHNDRVFNIAEIDILSPFQFRHHRVINKLLKEAMRRENKTEMTLRYWVDYSISLVLLLHDTHPDCNYFGVLKNKINNIKNNL